MSAPAAYPPGGLPADDLPEPSEYQRRFGRREGPHVAREDLRKLLLLQAAADQFENALRIYGGMCELPATAETAQNMGECLDSWRQDELAPAIKTAGESG